MLQFKKCYSSRKCVLRKKGPELTEDEKLIIDLLKSEDNQPIAQLKEKSALSGKKWDAAMKGLAKHGLTKVVVDGESKTVILINNSTIQIN